MSDDLIELIRLMNEKPIAFNKHYVFLGCGINGAVMLSQLVYWADKSKDPKGWIYKTGKEWTEETGLTRREQDTARKNLRELGFIDEHKHGVPCKVHFKVNQHVLYSALIELAQNRQTDAQNRQTDAQISQTECTDQPNLIGGKRQTNTESTTKNTTENTSKITTDISNVFEYWKYVFQKSQRTKLEGKRLSSIKSRLKDGYSVDEIKSAILNVSKSQWHLDNGQTDIELICRNQINLDKYLALKPNQNNGFNQQPNDTFNKLGALADEWDRSNADYTPY